MYTFTAITKKNRIIDRNAVLFYLLQAAHDAVEMCMEVIKDPEMKYSQLLKIFAMRAFHNIFSIRATRAEYLNQELVLEQGEFRAAAVEEFLKGRLGIFNQ